MLITPRLWMLSHQMLWWALSVSLMILVTHHLVMVGRWHLIFVWEIFGGFEGNGQTLRILSRLDKYTAEHGLNPTRRLMLGILKYPASYKATVIDESYGELRTPMWLSKAEDQHPPKCYMDDEQDVVAWILEPLVPEEKAGFIKTEEKFNKKLANGFTTSPFIKHWTRPLWSWRMTFRTASMIWKMQSLWAWFCAKIGKRTITLRTRYLKPVPWAAVFWQKSCSRMKVIGVKSHRWPGSRVYYQDRGKRVWDSWGNMRADQMECLHSRGLQEAAGSYFRTGEDKGHQKQQRPATRVQRSEAGCWVVWCSVLRPGKALT